jgi:methylphosphotriester-DNA--protein-cysteine methyltransferase
MEKKYLLIYVLAIMVSAVSIYSQPFVASKKSNKYHKESCTSALKIFYQNKIVFKNADDATYAGYIPCKVCKPGSGKNHKTESNVIQKESKSSDSYNTSGQCQATTKKGTQCKRKAQAGSIYCWQHKK